MADDKHDNPSSAQDHSPGDGKDVLFGWLVRRAAADLGLAEAIAASEAQRAEQIKRLEQNLLTQVQELQRRQSAAVGSVMPTTELRDLKAEMQTFADRMAWLESATRQASQASDSLKAEIAGVESQIADQQTRLEARHIGFEKLEETISAKVREWEQQLGAQPHDIEVINGELGKIQSQLQSLVERVTQVESASNPEAAAADREAERARWTAELDERNGDLAGLKAQMESLSQRVIQLAERGENEAAGAAEHAQWAKGLEAFIAARLGAFDDKLNDQLRLSESRGAELGNLRLEMHAWADRVAKVELLAQQTQSMTAAQGQRTEQAANSLKSDLAGLKAVLTQQLQNLKTPETLIKGFEEASGLKFQEIQRQLAQARQGAEVRDNQFRELRQELQTLVRRVTEAESIAHQSHALMVNESEQAAQQRAGLRTELDTLQAQLNKRPSSDVVVQNIEENLNVKIRELENQLAQRMRRLDHRDGEFREFKAQIRNLGERMTQAGAVPAPSQVGVAQSIQQSVAIPMDINALRARREEPLDRNNLLVETRPSGAQADAQGGNLPDDGLGGASKEQLKQLQERIFADIERARAELREKSGHWKVRR